MVCNADCPSAFVPWNSLRNSDHLRIFWIDSVSYVLCQGYDMIRMPLWVRFFFTLISQLQWHNVTWFCLESPKQHKAPLESDLMLHLSISTLWFTRFPTEDTNSTGATIITLSIPMSKHMTLMNHRIWNGRPVRSNPIWFLIMIYYWLRDSVSPSPMIFLWLWGNYINRSNFHSFRREENWTTTFFGY